MAIAERGGSHLTVGASVKIVAISLPALVLTTCPAFWAGCSSNSSSGGTTGDDQNATSRPPGAGDPAAPAACQVVAMKDGHTMTPDELKKLDDPVANFVLKGAGCPLTFTDIQAKIAKVDPCGKDEEKRPHDVNMTDPSHGRQVSTAQDNK